jgi:hypothetical protein
MALDIAAGILVAGIISGMFSLGAWMFAQGLDEGIRALTKEERFWLLVPYRPPSRSSPIAFLLSETSSAWPSHSSWLLCCIEIERTIP